MLMSSRFLRSLSLVDAARFGGAFSSGSSSSLSWSIDSSVSSIMFFKALSSSQLGVRQPLLRPDQLHLAQGYRPRRVFVARRQRRLVIARGLGDLGVDAATFQARHEGA